MRDREYRLCQSGRCGLGPVQGSAQGRCEIAHFGRGEAGTDRDALAAFLKEQGVATGVHYPIPLHLQKAFEYLGYKRGDFPVAEAYYDSALTIPLFPAMTDAMVERVIAAVLDAVR